MKIPFLPLALRSMALLSSATIRAADTPLEGQMDVMKKAFKALAKSMEAPVATEQKTYLEEIAKLHDAAVKARELTPDKATQIPEAERPAFLKAYVQQMDVTIAAIDGLQKAVAAADWPAAQKQIGDLKQDQKKGHTEFRSEE
jgi:soluble cytochrome b562